MSMPDNTLRKLMQTYFATQQALQIPEEERDSWEAKIRERLSAIRDIGFELSYNYSSRYAFDDCICNFYIQDPDRESGSSSRRYGFDHDKVKFRLLRNIKGELVIEHEYGGPASFVASLDQLVSFIEACQVQLDRRYTNVQKKQKLRDLKEQAIVASVKQLAKEEGFAYYTKSNSIRMYLYVRLSERECLELQIPFNKFEALFPQLRTIIQSARGLYEQGVKFKVKQNSDYKNEQRHGYSTLWIQPED
ncbi:MAG: hypothetical protein AAF639_02825 [Chloroflexota bacterium]